MTIPGGVRLSGDIHFLFYGISICGEGGITQIRVFIIGLLLLIKMRPAGAKGAQGLTVSLCHTAAMDLAQAGRTVESKIYDTLQWQVRGQPGG